MVSEELSALLPHMLIYLRILPSANRQDCKGRGCRVGDKGLKGILALGKWEG